MLLRDEAHPSDPHPSPWPQSLSAMAAATSPRDYPQDAIANIAALSACLLPIASFPFLPSRIPAHPLASTPPPSNRQTLGPIYAVFYSSLWGLVLFWILRYVLIDLLISPAFSGKIILPSLPIAWLTWVSLSFSCLTLIKWDYWNFWNTRIAHREPEPLDFVSAIGLGTGLLWKEFAYVFVAPHFGPWYEDYMVDGFVACGLAILACVNGRDFACRVVRRDFRSWYWLKDQAVKEKDDSIYAQEAPSWSWVVYRVVMIGAPLLWFAALIRAVILAVGF